MDMSEVIARINTLAAKAKAEGLTEEEIAQYKSSLMNYPITTIINDAGAYTEIEYASDTQKHIEQTYVPVSEFNSALERISALEQNAINS